MEKIMIKNKNIILKGILVIILIIAFCTWYQINKAHKEKLFDAMDKKITETALKCYNEEKCPNKTVYIKELYEFDYLPRTINPLNNEYLDENSYIEIKSPNEAELILVD